MKTLNAAMAICIVGSTFCACGGDDDIVPVTPIETGYLSVEFTITGVADPDICAQYNAAGFELRIFDLAGARVAEAEVPCNNFNASLELFEGAYIARARLVDTADNSVSQTLDLGTVTVMPNDERTINADFATETLVNPIDPDGGTTPDGG